LETITCKNCGSNQFVQNKLQYTCLHCNSVQVEKTYKSKRVVVLSIMMGFVMVITVLIYNKLTVLEKEINKPILGKQAIVDKQSQKHIVPVPYTDPDNPFSQTIFRVEEVIGQPLPIRSLETAIGNYYTLENHKAFYLAIHHSGKHVYGYAHGRSDKEAKESALTLCSLEAKKSKGSEKVGQCFLYLLNDTISKDIITSDIL